VALRERPEFRGPGFSYGDDFIEQQANACLAEPDGVKNPGNARKWLEAGFNHHITLTRHQISSPFLSLSGGALGFAMH
jgi:hypothetical protein